MRVASTAPLMHHVGDDWLPARNGWPLVKSRNRWCGRLYLMDAYYHVLLFTLYENWALTTDKYSPVTHRNKKHWRRQLWGTGARAPSTSICMDVCLLLRCFRLNKTCFRFNKTQTHYDVVSHFTREYIQAYIFVTVYCMNFIIFLCITLKLFSLVSCHPLHQILATPLTRSLTTS